MKKQVNLMLMPQVLKSRALAHITLNPFTHTSPKRTVANSVDSDKNCVIQCLIRACTVWFNKKKLKLTRLEQKSMVHHHKYPLFDL